jgi:5-methylcytosine-specific restriction endonuclease McrA
VSVQDALRRMADVDFDLYRDELRRAERRNARTPRRWTTRARAREVADYERDDPGNPLGRGYPLGRTLRQDGESHRDAWARIVRQDPCSYCGREAGTVDHVEPSRGPRPARGIGGAHVWLNLVGACEACNASKSDAQLLHFLGRRRGMMIPKLSRQPGGSVRVGARGQPAAGPG